MRLFKAAAVVCAGLFATPALATDMVVVKAGRLVDVVGERVLQNQLILIEGKRITAVGPEAAVSYPAGAPLIDLSDYTVLPGFIDTHTHVTSDPTISFYDYYHVSVGREAVLGVMNARRSLLAGFTVLRNVGATGYSDVGLRDGIERGDVMGPRVFASGPLIGITGGHCDENNLAPEYNHSAEGVADGVDAVRKMVRRHIKYGADLIKYCGTGGVFSKGDEPGAPQYTFEEAKAIVDEAHFMGRTVAVHAHGAEGIKIAIRAGADSIEHASLVDDEGIRMAVRAGTVFSMDIYNTDYTQAEGAKNGTPEEYLKKDRDIAEIQRENFRKALKAGVTMSFGTDAGVYPNGDNAKQFAVMVRYGMTPMQAIVAATRTGAKLLKVEKDYGAIETGRLADIIAVKGDPLTDVTVLERMKFVMREGRVYRGAAEQCKAAPSAWPCEPAD
ncbi:MAG: amidohydrolase family protein [Alphaproteobacteria bacterium]|mgnify:CR=1 FL=1|nr:amidohydrolase family protein [Alphaproteobacteria bacterium]